MTSRARTSLLGAGLAALVALSAPASAQPDTAASFLRGLNGSWERYADRPSGLGSDREESLAAPEPIPDPPLKPEYIDAWRAERAEIERLTEQGLPPANNYSACIPDGMPAMMQAMFPMEILETPGQITMIQEAYNQVRRIYLGQDEELMPPEQAEPRFWGHSVGRWEGDTLVVETVGIKEDVEFRNVPHSRQMRITERIRLIDEDYLENEVTVTDPVYLTGPWTWTWMYRRWPEYKLQEYVCEDNRYYRDPETGHQRLRIE